MRERRYELSEAADADLRSIYEWGLDRFGEVAADRYFDALVDRLAQISQTPHLWQAVDHIRLGYRCSVFSGHSIYYRVNNDFVLIVRILGRENPATNLPDA